MKRYRELTRIKISSNKQFVLPEPIRKKLKVFPGDELTFLQNEHGEIIVKNGSREALRLPLTPKEEEVHAFIDKALNSKDASVLLMVLDFSQEEVGLNMLQKYIELGENNVDLITSIYDEHKQNFNINHTQFTNTILRNQMDLELPNFYILPYQAVNRNRLSFPLEIKQKLNNEVIQKAPLVILLHANAYSTSVAYSDNNYLNFIQQSFEENGIQLQDLYIIDFKLNEKYVVIEGKIIK